MISNTSQIFSFWNVIQKIEKANEFVREEEQEGINRRKEQMAKSQHWRCLEFETTNWLLL